MRPEPDDRERIEAQERETPAFTARTLLDDMTGKLVFVRERLWMEVPDGFEGLLHDAEEAVEKLLGPVEAFDLAKARYMQLRSDSQAFRNACSCGMPTPCWPPEGASEVIL